MGCSGSGIWIVESGMRVGSPDACLPVLKLPEQLSDSTNQHAALSSTWHLAHGGAEKKIERGLIFSVVVVVIFHEILINVAGYCRR